MNINIRDTKFLNYNIRSCIIDDVEMYLVSDLLRQYNEINNTNKQFYHYLENKQTKELLKYYQNNEENTDHRNSEDQYEYDKLIYIPHVIKYINIPSNYFGGVNKGYVICEQLLIACLMWCDPIFATQVYDFIKNMREINNDRFVEILNSNKEKDKQIELLQEQVDQLKTRYNPEEYNYHFCVAYNELTNIITTVITKDQYQPVDKNIKRLYDLVACNPLILEEKLLDILSNDNRFTQISNKEFTTTINAKDIFWFFKNKCKKLRTELNWKKGLTSN